MANLSDANGTFTLINAKSLTKNEINETLNMLKELRNGEYSTHIHCNLTDDKPDIDTFINIGYNSLFFGIGRWLYEENIKYMFEWIQQNTDQYKTLLSKLNQNNIQFQFEYIDYTHIVNTTQFFGLYEKQTLKLSIVGLQGPTLKTRYFIPL